MFAIEYFVGSHRGTWARGLRRFPTAEEAQAVARADWLGELRDFKGAFMRRVVSA